MLEKTHVSGTALLPLLGVLVESEELGTHLESDLLIFFVGLDFDLVFELDNGFKVRVVLGLLGGGSCTGLLGLNSCPNKW